MSWKRTVAVAVAAAGVLTVAACGDEKVAPAPPAQAPASAGPAADAAPVGEAALLSGTAKSNNAEPGTGDWAPISGATRSEKAENWVQLTAGKAGDLNPVVVNGARLTLYRFDNDTAEPSKSNCNGECATTWPPVTVKKGGKIFIAGIRKADVGVVKRDDGRLQVTVGGWPVYRFNKDTKPGDTNGQGVGGTWFGVEPDGAKAGAQDGGAENPTPPPVNNGGQQGPAASAVTLFEQPNFGEDGSSEGVAGEDCRNVGRPGAASSLTAFGQLTIYSGPDCTGDSAVVGGDVPDLARIDFDDKIVSVRFG